ncbi:MAG: zinc ribbon domain-containing protein [Candidatus Heimdallarchaeota archaeon]|nr:MAG: zinc ribbon domain-containing protein [Candidatus Heimdallarchaeota archaeon]
MAWIGAIAACNNNGRRRKKPSKLILVITMVSLVLGIFVPLIMILGMDGSSSITLFPLIFIFIIMIGIIVLVTAGFTESLDQYDETADDASYRNSYRAKQRPRKTYYHKDEPREDYYWGSEPKSTSFFCTNCGVQLEADDRFCSSCGWRVN